MASASRPLADRVEVGAPGLVALIVRLLRHLPSTARRRVRQAAFDRARDAFNRGDLEVVFALFDRNVEYGPPPPMHEGDLLRGRTAVFEFWLGVLTRYENAIENLSLEEETPGRFVRKARLRHRAHQGGEVLTYVIVQTTELHRGRVVRQVNVLDPGENKEPVAPDAPTSSHVSRNSQTLADLRDFGHG